MFADDQGGGFQAHEILGLDADERNWIRIVEAAARRLRALQAADGSELEVRRSLASLIRRARDEMLAAVRETAS